MSAHHLLLFVLGFSSHAAVAGIASEAELLAAGSRAGELLCTADCHVTEADAHRHVAAMLWQAAAAARRETAWHVYRLADGSYTATWPRVGEADSASVRVPPLDRRHEYVSSGHTHWDDVEDFSALDWRWVQGNRRTLYLATREGELRRLTPRQTRSRARGGLVRAHESVAVSGQGVARLEVASQ